MEVFLHFTDNITLKDREKIGLLASLKRERERENKHAYGA